MVRSMRSLRRSFAVSLLLVSLLAHSVCGFAATLVAPFQPAFMGTWYDPTASGEGFDIWTFGDAASPQVFVVAFLGTPSASSGASTDLNPWFVAGGAFTGQSVTLPMMRSSAKLGVGTTAGTPPSPAVGSFVLSSSNNLCSAISAHIILSGDVQLDKTYNLVPLVQPLASSCQTGADQSEITPLFSNEKTCIGELCTDSIETVIAPALFDSGCVFSAQISFNGDARTVTSSSANGSNAARYTIGGSTFFVEADDSFIGPSFMNNLERCTGSIDGPL